MSEEGLGVGAISELATPNHVPYTTENYIVEPVQPSISSNLPSIIPDFMTVRPRFITPFPTLSKNSHELANRHPSQQPQCGKSPQAAPLRPTAESRADLGLARSTQPSTFPQFPKLPTEVRLMIWKAALPGPRIVEINIGKLKHTLEDREVEDANTEESTNSIWEHFLRFDDQEVEEEVHPMEGEPASDQKAGDGARPTEIETAPAEAPVFLGIRSSCVPPAVLFVNREAHEVGAKCFEKAFPSEVALAQTWFDFDLDTLYIRYDKFNNQVLSTHEGVIEAIRALCRYEDFVRIKNLALMISPQGDTHSYADLAEEVAEILSIFRGVQNLTLSFHHYERDPNDRSPISFIDHIDLQAVFESYWQSMFGPAGFTHRILLPKSHPDVIWGHPEDKKALKQFLTKWTSKPAAIPKIQCSVSITESVRDSPDSLFKKPEPLEPFGVERALNELTVENPTYTNLLQTTGILKSVQEKTRAFGPRTIRPGLYHCDFDPITGSMQSVYMKVPWRKYLDMALKKYAVAWKKEHPSIFESDGSSSESST
jgi:2EXR family